MKYLDEFRNKKIAQVLLKEVNGLVAQIGRVSLMEVCGTHTMAISRLGIRFSVPPSLKLLSGPGCPVCVTPIEVVDSTVTLAQNKNVILVTFGDMLKVPGSKMSLEKVRAEGGQVRIVYSPLDCLKIARKYPSKEVVFMAVGFETTIPTIAATVLAARKEKIKNFSLVSAGKVIPPAMEALASSGEVKIDGFICPGHVSTVIGSYPYNFLAEKYRIPCVIAGFETLDVLQGIILILRQIKNKQALVEIAYKRSVRPEGNPQARKIIYTVFEEAPSKWRGVGLIKNSGLQLRKNFVQYDALRKFGVALEEKPDPPGCQCGAILRGVKSPYQCKLFAKVCTPQNPVGACMVSSEGTCSAYYKYGEQKNVQCPKSKVSRHTAGSRRISGQS